jgi:hypothetical protein
MRQLALLVSQTVIVVYGTIEEKEKDEWRKLGEELARVFVLPWTDVARDVFDNAKPELSRLDMALLSAASRGATEKGSISGTLGETLRRNGIETTADRVRDRVFEVAGYVGDEKLVLDLLTHASELHWAVRDVVDPFPGQTVAAHQAKPLASVSGELMMIPAFKVAENLGTVYARLERLKRPADLEHRMTQAREIRLQLDKHVRKLLEADQRIREFRAKREDVADVPE